jgi:hypothetical protein
MKIQSSEFQNSFGENKVEKGFIDPNLVKEWQ